LSRSAALPILLIVLILSGISQCGSVFAVGSNVDRTIIVEPSYQIYEDHFSLAMPSDNFTVSFTLPYYQSLYSAQAFGPDNSTLNVLVSWEATNGSLSLLIETGGLSSFTLKTIFHYTTFVSNGSYTTYVNLYPTVEEPVSASTLLLIPAGAQLSSYPENLSLASIGGRTALVGGSNLVPHEAHNSTIVYNGSFELIEINALERILSVSSNGLAVTESVQLTNVNLDRINNVTIKMPPGASSLKVYDSIGYMDYLLNGDRLNIQLRSRLLPTEKSSFTISYEVPYSIAFQSNGGKVILNQTLLPEWCNFLVRNFNLVVSLPQGSTQVDCLGIEMVNGNNEFEFRASASNITPYSNRSFVISFTPPPYSIPPWVPLVSIIIILVLASVIVALRRRSKEATPPETPPTQQPKPKRTRQ